MWYTCKSLYKYKTWLLSSLEDQKLLDLINMLSSKNRQSNVMKSCFIRSMPTVDQLRHSNGNSPSSLFINNLKRANDSCGKFVITGQSQKRYVIGEIFTEILFICSDIMNKVDVIQKSQTIIWWTSSYLATRRLAEWLMSKFTLTLEHTNELYLHLIGFFKKMELR